MKRFLVISLFLGRIAMADYADNTLSYGAAIMPVNHSVYYSFNVGDDQHFNQDSKQFGYYRYGFGYGNLQVGNGIGFNTSTSSGIVLIGIKDSGNRVAPLWGVEPWGRIVINTNGSVASYYQILPALSTGIQVRDNGFQLTVAGKAGVGLGNWGRQDLAPDGSLSLGAATYLNLESVCIGANYVAFGANQLIEGNFKVKRGPHTVSIVLSTLNGRGLTESTFMVLWNYLDQ